jgi:hypothetical protein
MSAPSIPRLTRRRSRSTGILVLLGLLGLLTGCATTKPMGLSEALGGLAESKEAVAVFSLRTVNQHKPGYQPKVSHVFVWEDGKEKREKYSFTVDDPYRQGKDEFNEYLVSLRLPPGKYMLREFFGSAGTFPIRGMFGAPIYTRFELTPGTIVYFGHIEATIRQRTSDDQLRAGSLIPLIDQAVTGLSGGTFEIQISDNYENDLVAFRERYPGLVGASIERAILPPWSSPSEDAMK